MTRLVLDQVACSRGRGLLFEGLDLTLERGEGVLVTGANGVGKSSLLRIAAGLLAPTAGRVVREGHVALSAEASALDEDKSLFAALLFWARLDGRDDEAVALALAAMGLAPLAEVPVRLLSTGQRRRATLARVIASGAGICCSTSPRAAWMRPRLTNCRRRWRGISQAAGCCWRRATNPWGWKCGNWRCESVRPLVRRDLAHAFAHGGAWLPLVFYLLVATLFPFAIGPDAALLAKVGSGAL